MRLFNDDEIVDALSSADDARRQEALYVLFKSTDLRNKIFRTVFDQGADAETAREIFQFALVTFEQKVRTGVFEKRSSVHTYILGIAKWHLLNERRKNSRITEFNPLTHGSDAFVEPVEDALSDETRNAALYQIIEQLGERCRKLLPRWAENASPEEIAREFGFSSADMAKKETYRCRQKMIAFVENKPHLKNLLKP